MTESLPRLRAPRATRPKPGIVHLGLGAFIRAHGALYIDEAMAHSGGDWGIVGVSLQRPDQRDRLKPQDFAYTAIARDGTAETARLVTVLSDILVAREDPGAVIAQLADPAIRIVTLSVTEKGYCLDPATRRLRLDHPDIRHDIAHPQAPRSAPGFLLAGFAARRAAGLRPFTVLSCDNLPENGYVLRAAVLDLAARCDAGLAAWIAQEGRFPCSMVDSIVPALGEDEIAAIAARAGEHDAAPVVHEPFRQWVIVDDFVDGLRPDLGAVGVDLVADVAPFELMKLRCLNGAHSALAYLGALAGHQTMAEAVADPGLATYLDQLWQGEVLPGLTAPPGVDLFGYVADLRARFANPAIQHRTQQIASDGSQKLPQRLLAPLAENLAAGRPVACLSMAVAAWMRYCAGRDMAGNPVDLRDPIAPRLRAIHERDVGGEAVVAAFMALDMVFPPELAQDAALRAGLVQAYEALCAQGVRAALTALRPAP